MMSDGVVGPYQQHHLLSKFAGVVREVLRHWITNRPRYHCYPGSEIQMQILKLKKRLLIFIRENKTQTQHINLGTSNLNSIANGLNDPIKNTSPLNFK